MELTIRWRYIVGIDISKKQFDCFLLDHKTGTGYKSQVLNSKAGFEELDRWLRDHQVAPSETILVSEHTGRYGEHLLRWTTNTVWDHAVVKTTALNKVGAEHHRKDDAYDARGLAEYGYRFHDRLRPAKASKPAVGQITRLQAERRAMVDRRAALKSKLTEASAHDADMDRLITMWQQQVTVLTEHIDELEQRIAAIIEADPQLASRMQMMQTAPGMGKVLTPFWLSLFAGEQQLDPRKISSRFGFAPHSHSSGSSVNSPNRSSGHGNSEMRRLMHLAARSVSTHQPHYRQYLEKKKAEGKAELLIMNSIVNKLIRLYCAMWNKKAEYDPNYIQKNQHKWKKTA